VPAVLWARSQLALAHIGDSRAYALRDGADIVAAMTAADGPEQVVSSLIGLANAAGGPDNVACAVADIMDL
jgi:serine/threonine protein phosphatase PrpC